MCRTNTMESTNQNVPRVQKGHGKGTEEVQNFNAMEYAIK